MPWNILPFMLLFGSETVFEYRSPGQYCISADEELVVVQRVIQAMGDSTMVSSIVGYSDRHDPGSMEKREKICLSGTYEIPSDITAHEYVGVMRALHVYEVARRNSVSGFDRPVSFDGHPDANTIFIGGRQALGESEFSRRVEMEFAAPTSTEVPAPVLVTCECGPGVLPPQPACEAGNAGARLELKPAPKRFEHARAFGWTLLPVGLALGGASAFFAVSAVGQKRVSRNTSDGERALAYELDGFTYGRAAVWSGALAAGFIISGIILEALYARRHGKDR